MHLILCIIIKREADGGYKKSTGDRIERQEGGSKVGENLWDWIKGKVIDPYIYTGGYRIISS